MYHNSQTHLKWDQPIRMAGRLREPFDYFWNMTKSESHIRAWPKLAAASSLNLTLLPL